MILFFVAVIFHFNSHAHVERDGSNMTITADNENFNSHAHVERDSRGYYTSILMPISTHTLTWSVTIE